MKQWLAYAIAGLAALLMAGCTEDNFRSGGHDMLAGICAQSSHCTVNCDDGGPANSYGRCGVGGAP